VNAGSLEVVETFPIGCVAFGCYAGIGQEELTPISDIVVCMDNPTALGVVPNGTVDGCLENGVLV
jgi:hypothetical protein